MAGITPELLKMKTQSLNRNSRIMSKGATTLPGVSITPNELKMSLKRTPPPKPPKEDATPQGISVVLRPTGNLVRLISGDGSSGNENETEKIPPPMKPKPKPKPMKQSSTENDTPKKKPKPPPPVRDESLHHDDDGDDGSVFRSRLDSGADVHPHKIAEELHKHEISVDIDSSVSPPCNSKQLRPLPTLQSLGTPPEKSPITPFIRSEVKKYIASIPSPITLVHPEINNNMQIEEEYYDDVAANQDDPGEEMYDDVAQFQPPNDLEVETLPHPEESFGEELYDDVEAVIHESGLLADGQMTNEDTYDDTVGSPEGEDLYEGIPADEENDGEDLYEDLPAEQGNYPSTANTHIPAIPQSNPLSAEPKKSKKDLEKEEKRKKKEMELQKKKEEKERMEREKERKRREKIEEELMKKAKIKKGDLDSPMRVCIAKCSVKPSGKFDLEITKDEKLFVIKEDHGKCIVKNSQERIGYVEAANMEEEVEEDSYECIETVKERMGR